MRSGPLVYLGVPDIWIGLESWRREGGDSSIDPGVGEDHDGEGEVCAKELHHVVDLHAGHTALPSQRVVTKLSKGVLRHFSHC